MEKAQIVGAFGSWGAKKRRKKMGGGKKKLETIRWDTLVGTG